jgi:hypothetical protein
MTMVLGNAELRHSNNSIEIHTYRARPMTARRLAEVAALKASRLCSVKDLHSKVFLSILVIPNYKVVSLSIEICILEDDVVFHHLHGGQRALKIPFHEAAHLSHLIISAPWRLLAIKFLIEAHR